MSHQAIYRKYRPKTFDEVVGQDHVTETLKNQIMRDSTAHAYLFSGIRGTGKTSTAKIFARAVNCTNNTDGNPCNECETCLSILSERNMDVIEMDAASNNSVEDIRDLREKVKFLPSQSRFKVYIIDEVHMLSKGAFNALLKTLEEPPEHLLFILATTEPQKIPATILSRCQRFDLKRISVGDMMSAMKEICDDIGIEAEENALRMIANSSEGALRDALSILDRCLVYSVDKITYEDVVTLLGTVNYNTIIRFTDILIEKDIKELLTVLDEILSQGKEITLFLEGLIEHLRNLLILKSVEDGQSFVNTGEDAIKLMKGQSMKVSVDDNIRYIEELSETLALCKRAVNSRILLETSLIKLLSTKTAAAVETVYIERPVVETQPKDTVNEPPAKRNTDHGAGDEAAASQSVLVEEPVVLSGDDAEILKQVQENWGLILQTVKKQRISLNAIVKESQPYRVVKGEVILRFAEQYTFHLNRANAKESIAFMEQVFKNILKKDLKVRFIIEDSKKKESDEEIRKKINEKAFELFGKDKVKIID
ncbi:DNA polymerase-3 subunit gamma/tau [Dethiosulfatibacter aminovorans DSM 17477]|uniref:DNA-directed DNA polymerase n=1 Tax=Dethiosulfatibacter aminovorans DSM 17477 TaxID=1121476 RepID=A0A1M6CBX6_9FIRM|nr:DNA polymerase III subunit gamma/tau [Dethiosulfatibacter aminovorans]SHI58535.1 DNA polymerase-3 subunit gamma/tau [Dethiosulfatibacter aminovorans DSM 17477]